MANRLGRADLAAALWRAAHPPVREARFWVVQAMVVVIASAHLLIDLHSSLETAGFPVGLPVACLLAPVGYAAIRYGLAGSGATGLWATLLWLPDLLLPHDQGHTGSDLVNLALVDLAAFVFGLRIEAERLARESAEVATSEQLAAEARYRQLFEANRSPIVVLDQTGLVTDANTAARALFGDGIVGRDGTALFQGSGDLLVPAGSVLAFPDGREYHIRQMPVPASSGPASSQVVFEDVTEERAEGRQASRYARLVVEAEEQQRERLARELHDEPLQLFLYLARRLESLEAAPGMSVQVSRALDDARRQALDAAERLRAIAKGLRPPALDRLGFVAALSSLLDDAEEAGLEADLEVVGREVRLPTEVELSAFRIVEEAVRNALRHAAAKRVRVTVSFEEDHLAVSVADDGRGFSPEDVAGGDGAHLGLLGMRERAKLLGGRAEVRSALGQGTVVEVVVPLARTSAPRPEP
jgi:signal transduction histidine kinase